jgi:hypothetical protein
MRIEIKKFGTILTSRPAGREAAHAINAYIKPDSKEPLELDFTGVISVGPSWLDEVLSFLRDKYGKERVMILPSSNASVVQSLNIIDSN